MTEKHREQLHDAVEALARELNPRDAWAPLDVVTAIGLRDPVSDEVTLVIRVHDPARRLGGAGIEGLVQIGPNEFSFSRVEVAERLSTQLAQDAINFAKQGPCEHSRTERGKVAPLV